MFVIDRQICACCHNCACDCHTGQSLVVKVMVEGRECAKTVDAFLNR